MRIAFKLFVITGLVLMILIPAGLVIMVVDPHPHVRTTAQFDQADIKRARQILAPLKSSKADPMPLKSLTIPENELNLLIGYGLARFIDEKRVAVKVHLLPETAVVYATIQIPDIFLGKWINLAMAIRPRPGGLTIAQARVGRLRVPAPVAQWAANHVHARFMDIPRYAHAISLIQQVQTVDIDPGQVFLQFQWDPLMLATLTDEAKKQLFSSAHQKRLIEYHNFLVELTSSLEMKQASLISIIKPLFQRAVENTRLSQDPVAENTAVLQVMAAYVMNQDLAGFLAPDIRHTFSSSRPDVVFVLYGREDLAQHFLSSAAITVSTSGKLARSMGMAKEMEDARTGSGYSFVDISANEAGIRLAEFAISGPVNARLQQQRAAKISRENQFMPDIKHLPENMTAKTFQNQFNSPHSAAFARIMHRIESSIDACHIYQN